LADRLHRDPPPATMIPDFRSRFLHQLRSTCSLHPVAKRSIASPGHSACCRSSSASGLHRLGRAAATASPRMSVDRSKGHARTCNCSSIRPRAAPIRYRRVRAAIGHVPARPARGARASRTLPRRRFRCDTSTGAWTPGRSCRWCSSAPACWPVMIHSIPSTSPWSWNARRGLSSRSGRVDGLVTTPWAGAGRGTEQTPTAGSADPTGGVGSGCQSSARREPLEPARGVETLRRSRCQPRCALLTESLARCRGSLADTRVPRSHLRS
jgi:hypothetical protein